MWILNRGPAHSPSEALQPSYTRTRRVEETEDIKGPRIIDRTFLGQGKTHNSQEGFGRQVTILLASISTTR
jgi:hypothetical protein